MGQGITERKCELNLLIKSSGMETEIFRRLWQEALYFLDPPETMNVQAANDDLGNYHGERRLTTYSLFYEHGAITGAKDAAGNSLIEITSPIILDENHVENKRNPLAQLWKIRSAEFGGGHIRNRLFIKKGSSQSRSGDYDVPQFSVAVFDGFLYSYDAPNEFARFETIDGVSWLKEYLTLGLEEKWHKGRLLLLRETAYEGDYGFVAASYEDDGKGNIKALRPDGSKYDSDNPSDVPVLEYFPFRDFPYLRPWIGRRYRETGPLVMAYGTRVQFCTPTVGEGNTYSTVVFGSIPTKPLPFIRSNSKADIATATSIREMQFKSLLRMPPEYLREHRDTFNESFSQVDAEYWIKGGRDFLKESLESSPKAEDDELPAEPQPVEEAKPQSKRGKRHARS